MNKERIRILLIENDHDSIESIDRIVTVINGSQQYNNQVVIVPAMSVKEARGYLEIETTDLMLLSLSLPNESARDIVSRIESYIIDIPTIALVDSKNKDVALDSIQHGVQDFFVSTDIDADRFYYAILNAIERHKRSIVIQATSMIDNVTQVYNSRGFYKVMRHSMALAKRRDFGLTFVYFDIDDLSQMNKENGARGGDLTLKTVASILRGLFRESDIIARLGSDDFAIVAVGSSRGAATSIRIRLERAFSKIRETHRLQWDVRVSFGIHYTENEYTLAIEDHLSSAQKKMAEFRKLKRDK
ncbi:MAG TPA: diguanylate cyclase [Spirochaetota bacterium]